MKFSSETILAIAPGKREFGIAVFNGIELSHFLLRTLHYRGSKKILRAQVMKVIQECIASFQPQAIAVKAVSQYQQQSTVLRSIVRIVEQQGEVYEIPCTQVSITQIKALFSNNKNMTQQKVFQKLADLYPELSQFANRPNKWQNEYYHNLFSAVSVGVVLLRLRSKPR